MGVGFQKTDLDIEHVILDLEFRKYSHKWGIGISREKVTLLPSLHRQ